MKLPLPDWLSVKPQKRTAIELGFPVMQTAWTRRKQAWGDKASWAEDRWVSDWEGMDLWSILRTNMHSKFISSTDTLSGLRGPSFGTLGRSDSLHCADWHSLKIQSFPAAPNLSLSNADLQKACIWRDPLAFCLWGWNHTELLFASLLRASSNQRKSCQRTGLVSLDLSALPGVLSTAKSNQDFQHCCERHVKGESSLQTTAL